MEDALAYDRPVYDLLYLALSVSERRLPVTAYERLWNAPQHRNVGVYIQLL